MTLDYYEILGVKVNATIDEIKSAFRTLAKRHHPDTSSVGSESRDIYERVRVAYEILSEPTLRKSYDKQRQFEQNKIQKENLRSKLEDIDDATRLEIVLAWSTTKKTFNSSFTASCLNQLAEGKNLSYKQRACIENIIVSFSIDIEFWMNREERDKALDKYFEKQSQDDQGEYETL